jgi:hypothetical protein
MSLSEGKKKRLDRKSKIATFLTAVSILPHNRHANDGTAGTKKKCHKDISLL